MGTQTVLDKQEVASLFGNSNKQQAMLLLGKNIPESAVAELLGVTPALISQYKSDPVFKEGVRELLVEQSLAAKIRDDRLDALEDLAITQVEKTLGLLLRPTDVLAALKVINGLQRRGTTPLPRDQDTDTGSNVVQLSIPKGITEIALAVKLNSNQEVIEVNGQELRTMPSADVAKQAALRLPHGTKTITATADSPII